MPNKAYAILLNYDSEYDGGYLYFPIKREGQNYGGMPQFFGGTKNNGENDEETIKREMLEESDEKITLQAGGLKRIHNAIVNGNVYTFYIAKNYSGKHFLGDLKNKEMASIQKFFASIGKESDIENLLNKLKIDPTIEFSASETYQAFDKAIKWSEKQ